MENSTLGVEAEVCRQGGSGVLLPLFDNEWTWDPTLRFFLYFFGLGYMFCGVGVVSDIFMNAIEEITSKTVKKVNPASGEFVRVKVWNATVANLTLMALGSSAPEILLSIIELLGNEMYSGELGPSTIVGSAAFNLLCIIAVCISAIPPGEVRKIKELPVFVVTTTFSIFAYVWLLFILLVTSPSIVEIWEGVFTFIFFWMLISIAYMADRGYFGFRIEDDEDDDEDAPIRTRVISAELSAEDLAKIQSQLLQVHGRHLSDDELIKLIEEERSNQMPRKETQTDMRKVAPLDIESQAPSCIVGKGMEDVTPLRGTRRGTRRISIHPNFIQRFSTTNNSGVPSPTVGPSALRVPSEARPRSGTSVTAETVVSSRTEIQTEQAPAQRVDQEGSVSEGQGNSSQSNGPTVTFVDPKIRAVSAPPGPISDQSTVTPGALPVTMSGINLNGAPQNGKSGGTEKKVPPKLQKQKSFTVTTVYTPPSNPSKAIQKLRAKTRAAKAFKNTLSQKELEKLASKPEEQQTASDSRVRAWVQATGAVNTKRFAAAAIAAFGAISLDHRAEKVPIDSKTRFNEVAEEQALILHDNLEVRDRNRLQLLERKLMCLETFNNIYKALDQMRSSSVVPDTETNEEMRQRVTEECKWYKDLLGNLPQEVKDDRYCTMVLNRIAGYGSLEGRKISSSQFLKVLSTLRVWEICSPDVNAAIEFVREKIVEMSQLEFEDWLNAKFPQPPRPVSAPLPRSSGFRC